MVEKTSVKKNRTSGINEKNLQNLNGNGGGNSKD